MKIKGIAFAASIAATSVNSQNNVQGATTANNASTPTTSEGDVTVHYVTVGEIHNEFRVSMFGYIQISLQTLTKFRSLTVSPQMSGTSSPSNSGLQTTQSSEVPTVSHVSLSKTFQIMQTHLSIQTGSQPHRQTIRYGT